MALGNLFVSIRASADLFASDIRAIQRDAKELEKSFKPIADQAATIGLAFTAMGAAIVGAFSAAIKKTADYGDMMNDAAKRTGVATEQLSKLKLAAETNGASFEGLNTSLKFLAKNMEAATAGGKQQQAAFKAAGISAADLKNANGDVNVILNKLADTFKNSADGAGKTAVALSILGKSGTDLIPMLNEGSAGLKAWGDEAERTGRIVTTSAAQAADNFNDQLTLLEGSMSGLAGVVGNVFIPPLTDLIIKATSAVNAFREWSAEHPELIKAIGLLGAGLTGAGGLLLGLSGVLTIMPKVTAAFTLLTGPVGLTVAAVAALVAGVIYFRNEIGTVLMAAFATVLSGFEALLGGAQKVARAFGADGLADKIGDAKFALEDYRKKIDSYVIAGEAQYMTVQKTAKQLQAEELARINTTTATKKQTLSLEENTAALKAYDYEHDKVYQAWIKAYTAIDNNTAKLKEYLATGQALAPILRTVSDGIAAYTTATYGAAGAQFDLNTQLNKTIQASNIKILTTIDPQSQANLDKFNADQAAAVAKLKQATEDVKNSAGHIFDDMFTKGENVFSSLFNLLKGGALSLGRAIFEDFTGALLGPVKAAFDDFFQGVFDGPVKKLGQKMGEWLGNVLGNTLSDVTGTVASSAGGAASGAASGAAGAAGSVASGAMSLVSAISGVASAVGSIGTMIGTFRLEGTMNAVEYNTRASEIHLRVMIDQILWPMKGALDWLVEHGSNEMINQLDAIYNAIVGLGSLITTMPMVTQTPVVPVPAGDGTSTGGGFWAQFYADNPWLLANGLLANGTDYVQRDGLAYLHQGEAVIPREENTGRAGNTITYNFHFHGGSRSQLEEFKRAINTNRGGLRDALQGI